MRLLVFAVSVLWLLSAPLLVRGQASDVSSVIIRGITTYVDLTVPQFEMSFIARSTGQPFRFKPRVPGKFGKKQLARAQRAVTLAERWFQTAQVNSTSCSAVNSTSAPTALEVLGRLLIGQTAVFVDDNANNALDEPRDTSYLAEAVFNPLDVQPFELSLGTSDFAIQVVQGIARRSSRLDTTTGTLIRSLSGLFGVPEMLTPVRFAPRTAPGGEAGTATAQNSIALDPTSRTRNITCSVSRDADAGYLHLAQPVPNEPTSIGGYGTGQLNVGFTTRFHYFTVFFDENGDNVFNPWERALSPAALVALQNNPVVARRPFIITTGLTPIPTTTISVFSVAVGEAGVEQLLLTITDPSRSIVDNPNTELTLRPHLLNTTNPRCNAVPNSNLTTVASKSIFDLPTAITTASRDGTSFLIGNAERLATPTVFEDQFAASIRLYRPLRNTATNGIATPLMRQSNQFALQCLLDTGNSGAPGALSQRQTLLQGGSNAIFSVSSNGCSGMSAATQLTLGDTPSCGFNVCFHDQAVAVRRIYESARYLSFVALLSNATQGSISSSTIVNVLRNYNVRVTPGPLTAYAVNMSTLSSGLRKLEFQHGLDRANASTVIPGDNACMVVSLQFNYTQCSTPGQNLLLEFGLLASTLPFPFYTIADRLATISLIQAAACVNFVANATTTTTAPATGTPAPTGDNGDDDNDNSTVAFLVVFFVGAAIVSLVVWFYIA